MKRKGEKKLEEEEEEVDKKTKIGDEIPDIIPDGYEANRDFFTFPRPIYRTFPKRKYLYPHCHPDPVKSFWNESRFFNESQFPIFGNPSNSKKNSNNFGDYEEENDSNLNLEKSILHELFPLAEHGPLSTIFSFLDPKDVVRRVSKVSKLFLRLSHYYLIHQFNPTRSILLKFFNFKNPIAEDLCISILANKRTNGVSRIRLKLPTGEICSFLTFAIFHSYSILFHYLYFGSLTIRTSENEEIKKKYNPMNIVQIIYPFNRNNEHNRTFRELEPIEPNFPTDIDLASDLFLSRIVSCFILHDDDLEAKKITLTWEILRCLIYKKEFSILEYISKNYDECLSDIYYVNDWDYSIFSSLFFFRFFMLNYERGVTERLFQVSKLCNLEINLESVKNEFVGYCKFMDFPMLMFLCQSSDGVQYFEASRSDQFLRTVCYENENLSLSNKKSIVDLIFFENDRTPFKKDMKRGYEFVFFYGSHGYLDELKEVLKCVDVQLIDQRVFDYDRFINHPEALKIIMESKKIPISYKLIENNVILPLRSQNNENSKNEINIFFQNYKYSESNDEELISTFVKMSLSFSHNMIFKKLLGLKGYKITEDVLVHSITNRISKEIVLYLFNRFLTDKFNKKTFAQEKLKDYNHIFLLSTKNIYRYIGLFSVFSEMALKSPKPSFIPSLSSMIRCESIAGKKVSDLWMENYQPKRLKELLFFFFNCCQRKRKEYIKKLRKKKFWRDGYLLYFSFDQRKNEQKLFTEMFPKMKRKYVLSCFHCGKKVYPLKKKVIFGTNFVKCQAQGCSENPKYLKNNFKFWKDLREIEKIFCENCKRRIRNKNYCINCAKYI